jgi:cardiolipin synthase C
MAARRLAVLCLLLPLVACRTPAWPEGAQSAGPAPPETPAGDLSAAFEALPGSPVGEIPVRPLLHNPEAWIARWRLLAEAQSHLDVGYFILTQDVFGMAFLGHLLHKAEAGVPVRLLIDTIGRAMGDLPGEDDCLPALAPVPGIEIRVYRPLRNRVVTALASLDPIAAAASNHDKIIVADSGRGLIGGRNIAAKYFADPADLAGAFYDLDLLLEDATAAAFLTTAFERIYESGQSEKLDLIREPRRVRCLTEMRRAYRVMDDWLRGEGATASASTGTQRRWWEEIAAYPRLRGELDRPLPPAVTAPVVLLDSVPRPRPRPDPVSGSLLALLQGASRDVLIASPYLVLTEDAAETFRASGARGVELRVLTNSPVSTDNPLSQEMFLAQWPSLMAHVPNLRIFTSGTGRNVHTKLAVFDGKVVLAGAYNLDPISLTLNGEIAAAIWSPGLARRLAAWPAGVIAAGPPTAYEYRIARNRLGRPVYGAGDEPRVAFGAAAHSDPAGWPETPHLWRVLGLATRWPGSPRVFGDL